MCKAQIQDITDFWLFQILKEGTGEIWRMEWINELSKIGLPTIVGVVIGIFGLIKGLESIYGWCKKKFLLFYNKKKDSDKLVEDVSSHDSEISLLNDKIDDLTESIKRRNKIDDKYDRDTARVVLLDMYDRVRTQGYITMIQKEAYDELYGSYKNKQGNGLFVKTIDPFIQNAEVRN